MSRIWSIPRAVLGGAMAVGSVTAAVLSLAYDRASYWWVYCQARSNGSSHKNAKATVDFAMLYRELLRGMARQTASQVGSEVLGAAKSEPESVGVAAVVDGDVIPLATARNWSADKGEA